ncbi:MAG: SDR family oxidoreductase [Lutibacter sp.]|nr:SDR family oxidoreductase [Lutibacter sp.]
MNSIENNLDFYYIITGATSGIGKTLVYELDNIGEKLILMARSSEKLKELESNFKTEHVYITVDLSNIQNLIDVLQTINYKIKGFVHCAGLESVLPLRQVSYLKFDNIMKIHVYSFVEILKYIEKNKSIGENYLTSIIAISSIASQTGGVGQSMYSASKAGLEALVRVLSKELSNKKIRLNSIQPGIVNTEMTERWRRKIGISNVNDLNKLQLNGIAESSDIVSLILFLLSDNSKQISGTEIKIDGGGPINKYF